MKRNFNIIPLSRDHHSGLLFCWKIRQGVQLNVAPQRIAAYVKYFWMHHLQAHFYEEENYLFILKNDANCQQAIAEHAIIKNLIITVSSESCGSVELLELADVVEKHIRFEERNLFPYLESTLSTKQLNEIGAVLQTLHNVQNEDNFKDEFWKPQMNS